MSPVAKQLDLKLTDELRTECIRFLERITEYQPTLVLTKGAENGSPREYWSYGAYGPENLQTLGPEFNRLGHVLLYQVSGLTVAIPQTHLLRELEGKTLARTANGIEILDHIGDI